MKMSLQVILSAEKIVFFKRVGADMLSYLKRNRFRCIFWLFFSCIVSVLAPLKTFQLKWLIDSTSLQEAFRYMCLILGITVLSFVFESLCRKIYARIATDAIHHLRKDLMEKILHRTYKEYMADNDGIYLSRLTSDIRILYDDFFMAIFDIVFWGGIMVVSLFLFYWLNPILLIIAILISIPPLIIPKVMNARLISVRSEYSTEMGIYTQTTKELMGGYEVISNFLREGFFAQKHERASSIAANKEYYYQQNMNSVTMCTSLISNLTFSVMLLVGILLVYNGKITLGTMTSATSLINFVISPCQRVTQAFAKLKGSKGVRENFSSSLQTETFTKIGSKTKLADGSTVICKNVSFSYPGSDQAILQSLSLSVHKQEKVAIVGESGCGKTTLAKLLYQYFPTYNGSIFVGNTDIREIDRKSFCEKIGYLSQSTFLFHDTIRNNICLGQHFSDEQIQNAVHTAGLASFINDLPTGLETVLDENGNNLSGGQRQRMGIARMIIRHYQLVIADEVTANLDVDTTEQIMQNLLSLPCSLIVITHNILGSYMNQFDKVYRIQDGKAFEEMKV